MITAVAPDIHTYLNIVLAVKDPEMCSRDVDTYSCHRWPRWNLLARAQINVDDTAGSDSNSGTTKRDESRMKGLAR